MRVLYGVAGEGLGHAMRSQVVLRHLVDAGHDVRVVTSGRAAEVLSARGFDVEPIRGLSLTCRRGGVARTRSLASFLAASPSMAGHNQRVFRAVMEAYDPEVCISDFDSFAHAVGLWAGRPVLSLDHQHVIDRFHHPRDLRVRHLHVARALVSAKLPGCERYVVTSFYAPRARPALAANTSLVGPILREPVRALEARRGDHVLVYQSAHGDPGLLAALAAMPDVPFRVYGVPPAHVGDHVSFRPFSEAGFLDDLASARAVICNGGYTTLSEAVCLGKPVLSVPLRRHGEQQLNAAWLERMGLGRRAPRVSPAAVRSVLEMEPPTAPVRPGNEDALRAVDAFLEAA